MENETFVPVICENCKFSEPHGADNFKFCRKNAPKGELSCYQQPIPSNAVWPLVKDSDWCGEFAPQED